jgi:formylglycine-generating enzyme required for sulfatase activity/tRNA A-37 threonylcarbamoyl transferase component Bud32
VLGRGGFGIVLEAIDEKLRRRVALKVLRPELAGNATASKRFLREARAAAAVRHPNVVGVYAVEENAPTPYLVMEYITGPTLQQRLDQGGAMALTEVLRLGRQIAQGLAAAHALGLIHRDVKPANILLESGSGGPETSERVKVTDFGLARAVDDASVTASGVVTGTPLYMAPEQALEGKVDHRADLFSLGSVLYALCTGQPPFAAPTPTAVLLRVCEEEPRPIRHLNPKVPPWLCAIIGRLHAKDPAARFGTAREVADLLGRCLAELQRHGRVRSVPCQALPDAGGRRRPWRWAAGGVLALAALALLAWWFGRHGGAAVGPGPVPAPAVPEAGQPRPLPAEFTNVLGMKFVLVPRGRSWLGGGAGKPGKTEVEFTRDFYLGKYEVTQEEWEAVMGNNPSRFSRAGDGKDAVKDVPDAERRRFPVDTASWDRAQDFLRKLNERAPEASWVYRLPTQVEWEYSCRGGPMSDPAESAWDYYLEQPSNQLRPGQANFGAQEKAPGRPCKVGSYPPNRLGLHDMHGNVFEWCTDVRKDNGHPYRRGGSFGHRADAAWAASSGDYPRHPAEPGCGLRVARVPVDEEN